MKLDLRSLTTSLALCLIVLTAACDEINKEQRRRRVLQDTNQVHSAVQEAIKTEADLARLSAPAQTAAKTETAKPATEVTELKIEDIKVGTGAEAVAGKSVTVHYTGWLTNGTKFDSSKDRNEPFTFPLGGGQVIKGWDQGVAGMKVGGVRKLTISPSLGYGQRDMGKIPPNSTLVFEVELLGVN